MRYPSYPLRLFTFLLLLGLSLSACKGDDDEGVIVDFNKSRGATWVPVSTQEIGPLGREIATIDGVTIAEQAASGLSFTRTTLSGETYNVSGERLFSDGTSVFGLPFGREVMLFGRNTGGAGNSLSGYRVSPGAAPIPVSFCDETHGACSLFAPQSVAEGVLALELLAVTDTLTTYALHWLPRGEVRAIVLDTFRSPAFLSGVYLDCDGTEVFVVLGGLGKEGAMAIKFPVNEPVGKVQYSTLYSPRTDLSFPNSPLVSLLGSEFFGVVVPRNSTENFNRSARLTWDRRTLELREAGDEILEGRGQLLLPATKYRATDYDAISGIGQFAYLRGKGIQLFENRDGAYQRVWDGRAPAWHWNVRADVLDVVAVFGRQDGMLYVHSERELFEISESTGTVSRIWEFDISGAFGPTITSFDDRVIITTAELLGDRIVLSGFRASPGGSTTPEYYGATVEL